MRAFETRAMSTRYRVLFSFMLVALVASGGRLRAQGPATPAVEEEVPTAPVAVDGVVLFQVRGVSSYPADARARLIGDRIAAAAADKGVTIPSVRSVDADGAVRIAAGERPIMVVVDADARL